MAQNFQFNKEVMEEKKKKTIIPSGQVGIYEIEKHLRKELNKIRIAKQNKYGAVINLPVWMGNHKFKLVMVK
jgi:hypothetical protein